MTQKAPIYTISLDEQNMVSLLNHLYQGCTEEVIQFVKTHQLLGYLIEAFGRIDLFYPNAPLRLELHTDPEEAYTKLFIAILTNMPTQKAFQQGLVMYKDWDLIKENNFRKLVTIDTTPTAQDACTKAQAILEMIAKDEK